MRLPFPERISLLYAFGFAAVLCAVQIFEGTSGPFALCCLLFIVIATATFNLAGGFTRPSGSYVFFYAVLGAIVGLVWKALLGEPADSNLSAPQTTIEVYLGGICAMLAAVYISRKLTTKRPLLGTMLDETRTQNATVGCMVTGLLLTFILTVVPYRDASVLSALSQLNRFLPLAILLGVARQIRKSRGTSCITIPVLLSGVVLFIGGLIGFSKEGMLTPFFCWLVVAASLRYRLSLYQIVGCVLVGLFIFQYLVPYSQYGRIYRSDSLSKDIDTSISLLSNLGYVREQNKIMQEDSREEAAIITYYNTPQGFFDRLQMIAPDDSLIEVTEQQGTYGLLPIVLSFENLVPHLFWPNKPPVITGNAYAHQIGGIDEDDTTTGISFTPSAEGYHLARWTGVLVIAPILWIMLFTLFDSLCGDVRKSPWGLLVIPTFAHAAPEGLLTGVVYMLGYTAITIVFAAVMTTYLMPIIGSLIIGPEKFKGAMRSPNVKPVASRFFGV